MTARQVRKQVGMRAPRCFASLENTSKVSDPISKRNRVRTQDEKKHYKEKVANREKGVISQRETQSTTDRLAAYRKMDERKATKTDPFVQDVWSMGSLKERRTEFRHEFIEPHVTDHNLCNTGTPVANVPKSAFHKRSQLNAIPLPHPGTSYNPSFKDHQDLMDSVTTYETTIIRREDHLKRVTTSMFDKVTAQQRDANHLNDFNAILNEKGEQQLHFIFDIQLYFYAP